VNYTSLLERGEKLIAQQSMSTDELRKMVTTLEDVWSSLNDCWDGWKKMLTELYDLKVCTSRSRKIEHMAQLLQTAYGSDL